MFDLKAPKAWSQKVLRTFLHLFRKPWRRLFWVILGIVLVGGLSGLLGLQPSASVAGPVVGSVAGSGASDALQLLQQGEERYQAGAYQMAAERFQAALRAAQGQALTEATALSNLGLAQLQLGDYTAAAQALQASLQRLPSAAASPISPAQKPAQQVLAATLNIQGQLQLVQGKTEAALSTWQTAEQLYQRLGDWVGQTQSQINQAQAEQRLGFYRRSLERLSRVNQQLAQQPDHPTKVLALQNLGNAYRLTGELAQAETTLQAAWQLAQRLADPHLQYLVSLSLGDTYRDQGRSWQEQQVAVTDMAANPWQCPLPPFGSTQDLGSARPTDLLRYQQALQAYRQAERLAPTERQRLTATLNRLDLLVILQDWSQVQALWQQHRAEVLALPPGRSSFFAQIRTAVDLSCAKQARALTPVAWPEIAQLLAQTVQQAKATGDLRAESFSLGYLGGLYALSGQHANAQALTNTALDLAQSLQANDLRYRWQWQLGQLYWGQHRLSEALAAYAEAIKYLRLLRSDLATINSAVQFSFRDQVEPVYRQYVALLLQPDQPRQPVSQARLSQARQVIESLQIAELENFFRSACLDAPPVALEQLDTQAAVVYPVVLGNHIQIILSLPQQPLQLFNTELPANWITLTERFQQALGQHNSPDVAPLGQQLYDWLITPIVPALQAGKFQTLVFVLDSPLRNVPMAALQDGRQYLVEKYPLGLTPGLQLARPQFSRLASSAALRRSSSESTMNQPLLFAGLTEARQGFPSLRFVQQEIRNLQAAMPRGRLLINQDFTGERLKKIVQNQRFGVVHLATHGQFSSQIEQTFILTWNQQLGIPQLQGLLNPLGERATPIDLLVLSACETATGDRRASLGLAGMAVQAGAKSTLASLWLVNDEAATRFIQGFYQALNQPQTQKAEALRQAQLSLLRDPRYRHPYYWAPFVLVGDWS
jgi:CHAT domain-containing protein/tetratricopeptide (TPR) repeat protein